MTLPENVTLRLVVKVQGRCNRRSVWQLDGQVYQRATLVDARPRNRASLFIIIMELSKVSQVSTTDEISHQQPISTTEPPNIPTFRLILLIIGLCIGLFLSLLDTSIVATALYSIGTSFSAPHTSTWVALSYTLSYLSFAVPIANLSDVIGRRAAWLLVFTIFFIFSLACGFARTLWQLVGSSSLSSKLASDQTPGTLLCSWHHRWWHVCVGASSSPGNSSLRTAQSAPSCPLAYSNAVYTPPPS